MRGLLDRALAACLLVQREEVSRLFLWCWCREEGERVLTNTSRDMCPHNMANWGREEKKEVDGSGSSLSITSEITNVLAIGSRTRTLCQENEFSLFYSHMQLGFHDTAVLLVPRHMNVHQSSMSFS